MFHLNLSIMNTNLNVLKFGGTSVKDADAIQNLASILSHRNEKTMVVVSAMATITNSLVEIIDSLETKNIENAMTLVEHIKRKHKCVSKDLKIEKETEAYIDSQCNNLLKYIEATDILGELSPKTKDMILSRGELLSSYLVNTYLQNINVKSTRVSPDCLIKTNSRFTEAEVDFEQTKIACGKYIEEFEHFDFVITGGFVGSDKEGKITTLGRGGSDYSAAIIASVTEAKALEIWTDVDGIMTSDQGLLKMLC